MAATRVAVVGASNDPTKLTGRPIAYMMRRGFKGEIIPINPARTEVQGLKAYPSLAALEQPVDLAIVGTAAAQVEEVIEEGVKSERQIVRRVELRIFRARIRRRSATSATDGTGAPTQHRHRRPELPRRNQRGNRFDRLIHDGDGGERSRPRAASASPARAAPSALIGLILCSRRGSASAAGSPPGTSATSTSPRAWECWLRTR